ncbi:MAG: VWA domain-containing protein [Calditrichae bacterium]|nr:VWA domain-containing protein [Calditrichia bacterium]
MYSKIFSFLFVFSTLLFGQGRIVIQGPEIPKDIPVNPVELTSVDANIVLEQDVAKVELQQEFLNKSNRALQGEYIYSLPGIAQVDDFYLWINGIKTKGQLLDKDKARSVYESIMRRMLDPALVEFVDYGLFRAQIFPIPAGQKRQISLSYSQVVPFEGGNYRFELPVRQSGQSVIEKYRIKIKLNSKQDLDNIYSPTHKISVDREDANSAVISFDENNTDADQNFVLFYSLSEKDINGSLITFRPRTDRDGYFMFFANPAFGKNSRQVIAKDVIFVIDVSGSMGGEKIEQAREALRFCVNVLDKNDRFEIISFSSSVHNFSGRLINADKDTKNNALYFIDNLNANGGTNINSALLKALKLKKTKDARPTSIVFLTDGLPTEGEQDVAKIVGNLQSAPGKFIRFFNFGVGYDVNTWLLDNIATESNGSVTYVKPAENIEVAISGLFTKISSPLLTDCSIDFGNIHVYDVFPEKIPDVFKGQRIMITGRYRNNGNSVIALKGRENGKNKTFEYNMNFTKSEKDNDFVSKLWANRKVNYLLNRIRFEGENQEWVTSVKELAEEFGIVTPYTSYLVTEEKNEYANLQARPDMAPMAAQMKKQKEVRQGRGLGDVLDLLGGSMEKDANKATGYQSVMGSAARQQVMEEAEQADELLMSRKNISGKTFILENGIWKEKDIDLKGNNIHKIKFMDPKYIELSRKNEDVRKILALGSDVLFQWDGKIYQVEK